MRRKSDPDAPLRLPIKLEHCSNGEYVPPRPSAALQRARRFALDAALEAARRVGVDRRRFLSSTCGAATTLLALNQLGCGGGGRYAGPGGPGVGSGGPGPRDVPPRAPPELADLRPAQPPGAAALHRPQPRPARLTAVPPEPKCSNLRPGRP